MIIIWSKFNQTWLNSELRFYLDFTRTELGLYSDFTRTLLGLSSYFTRILLGLSSDFTRILLRLSSDSGRTEVKLLSFYSVSAQTTQTRTLIGLWLDWWLSVKYWGIQFIQHLENIVTLNIFNPRMVYNSHVYSYSNRNLLSMTGKFEEQIEEFSLFNTCRTLSPPIFLIYKWFTIAMCIQIQIEIYLAWLGNLKNR